MDKSAPEDVSDSIRYQGKAVNDLDWILQFLSDQETGVLGLIDDKSPHLVTQLFVYDDDKGAIFMHGAQAGRAYNLVENGDRLRASFTTSEKGRYIPADEPGILLSSTQAWLRMEPLISSLARRRNNVFSNNSWLNSHPS